jgi:ethanolamine utilization protein EutQ (cupin superfamily)
VEKAFEVFRRKTAKVAFEGGADTGNTLDRLVNETNSDQLGGGYFSINGVESHAIMPYDELAICLEGRLKLTVAGVVHDLDPGDFAWIPKGTEVTFSGENAICFYAAYPVDWRTRDG